MPCGVHLGVKLMYICTKRNRCECCQMTVCRYTPVLRVSQYGPAAKISWVILCQPVQIIRVGSPDSPQNSNRTQTPKRVGMERTTTTKKPNNRSIPTSQTDRRQVTLRHIYIPSDKAILVYTYTFFVVVFLLVASCVKSCLLCVSCPSIRRCFGTRASLSRMDEGFRILYEVVMP